MNEPDRTQWEIRCAFNGFCKKVLKCGASNARREVKHRQKYEVNFSDLTPEEEHQLYTVDKYFDDGGTDDCFCEAGKKITPKLLADAIYSLPETKRQAVLLHYFFEMSDVEIAALYHIPRSTVQYRRTSSFELLKRFLEERAYDENEW